MANIYNNVTNASVFSTAILRLFQMEMKNLFSDLLLHSKFKGFRDLSRDLVMAKQMSCRVTEI